MLAVGLLPLLAIGDGRESGAVTAYSAIAVCALRRYMVVGVDFVCSRHLGRRRRRERAEAYECGGRAGDDCKRKNELLHFQIP